MAKYIDKSALVAEIKSRISDIEVSQKTGLIKKRDADKKILLFKSILSLIDTLEVKEVDTEQLNKILNWWKGVTTDYSAYKVKEVDFEKELNKEWNKCEPTDEGMGLEIASIEHEQFDNIAKHFFELGLSVKIKAQKGE